MKIYRQLSTLALTYALTTAMLSAQTTSNSITTGYAVITPTDGTPDGLLAFGSLTLTVNSLISQGIFAASPLVNAASIPISTDSTRSQDTGVAIVNPNPQSVNISLVLRFATAGTAPQTTSFTLGGGQQSAKFVTEVFGPQATAQGVPAVLTMVSNMPVGVVGFNFTGTNFAAVPVTDLTTVLGPNALTTLNSDITGVTAPTSVSANLTSSLQISTIGGTNVLVPITNQFFPQITSSVGGDGSIMLSQIASNGGWMTGIVIQNPASAARTIRVDFFDASGSPMTVQFQSGTGSSFTGITVPAFGTFSLIPNNS